MTNTIKAIIFNILNEYKEALMRKKILIVASTMSHLSNFHQPYITELKRDYDVYTMAKNDSGYVADFNIQFEKKAFIIKNLGLAGQIRKILEENKFDIIFLNTTLAAFYVRCALKDMKNRPKVVNIVHGYLFSRHVCFFKRFVFKVAEKFLARQTDNIITMNMEDYDYAKKHKLSTNKVYFINGMGVDQSRLKNIKESKPKLNSFNFLFIGELSSRKNQKFLIKFIKNLEKFDYDAKLNLLGYGSYEHKLKKLAKKLGIENKVNFLGYDRDIGKYLEASDFYVSASVIEGCPFNIIEAMMAKRVVFSANIKGAVDVIEDLQNGVLYKFGSLKDFVTKFRLVKNNLKLQSEITNNASEKSKKYELGKVFSENMELAKKLIEG